AETAPATGAALEAAGRKAPADGLVVVCGSLYLVGEVKTLPACEGDAPAPPSPSGLRRASKAGG
ncbi:MAG: hypothetical protein WBE00_04115, partial [Phycisphaerae bacterium]